MSKTTTADLRLMAENAVKGFLINTGQGHAHVYYSPDEGKLVTRDAPSGNAQISANLAGLDRSQLQRIIIDSQSKVFHPAYKLAAYHHPSKGWMVQHLSDKLVKNNLIANQRLGNIPTTNTGDTMVHNTNNVPHGLGLSALLEQASSEDVLIPPSLFGLCTNQRDQLAYNADGDSMQTGKAKVSPNRSITKQSDMYDNHDDDDEDDDYDNDSSDDDEFVDNDEDETMPVADGPEITENMLHLLSPRERANIMLIPTIDWAVDVRQVITNQCVSADPVNAIRQRIMDQDPVRQMRAKLGTKLSRRQLARNAKDTASGIHSYDTEGAGQETHSMYATFDQDHGVPPRWDSSSVNKSDLAHRDRTNAARLMGGSAYEYENSVDDDEDDILPPAPGLFGPGDTRDTLRRM